jgi:hypothetical protein
LRNPIDIVAELVSRIDYSIEALTVTYVDPNIITNPTQSGVPYSIFTCDIKYATTEMKLNGYKIVSIIDHGNRFEMIVKEPITVPLYLSQPVYYHGTAIAVNTKLGLAETNINRPITFPMMYFPETRKGTRYPKETPIEMEADCRLVIAVTFNDAWNAQQLKDQCINPMLKLLEEFNKAVDNDVMIEVSDYNVEQFSKLGDKIEGKGTIFNAINDKMSGIVVDFTMSVAHDFRCVCCCPE